MATKIDNEYPLSPTNDELSGGEEESDNLDSNYEQIQNKPENNDFANIIKKLEFTGALLRKPKIEKEFHCYTCEQNFDAWVDFEKHLIQHVSLPSVVLDKLPSDEEDTAPSGDENWSDDEVHQPQSKTEVKSTQQKIDISQILMKPGICIKKTPDTNIPCDTALNKLSGLGFTIKKNSAPIKTEKVEESELENKNNLMKKLGNLGGIKLKLRSDGCNANTFKVINGLKDFQASDDEDEVSENEDSRCEEEPSQDDNSQNKKQEEDIEPDSEDEEQCFTNSGQSSEIQMNLLQGKTVKTEPNMIIKSSSANKNAHNVLEGLKVMVQEIPDKETPLAKPPGRLSVKQTPKRGANNPSLVKTQELSQTIKTDSLLLKELQKKQPERRESSSDSVVVKTEAQEFTNSSTNMSNAPLLTRLIKSEDSSPPPIDRAPTPIIAKIKSEPEVVNTTHQVSTSSTNSSVLQTSSLLPVSKTEDTSMTIIEINGDSNDEDDDCCVVSATPAPDVKSVIPKVENPTPLPPPSYPTSYSSAAQNIYNSATTVSSRLTSMPSTEKQHNFNWNAPDSKPAIDTLEKSADEIFESLLSSNTKKENMSSLVDVNEYISLDTLGPQHSCEVCNTRFTDTSRLEEHKRLTGHSNSLMTPSVSSTLLPYNNSTSNILSSLLPVKQLAEQVGKLSTINNSNSGFTHQQNVMINIQAYPGSGGVMVPPQPYNSYPSGHSSQTYPQPPNTMYTAPQGPPMSNQYPGSNYAQTYSQYPTPMSKAGYPGPIPPNAYVNASAPYSTASPLQNMQQSIYGQSDASGMMNQHPVPLGPPGSSPSQVYSSVSSPSIMKQSNSIKIQNVQTFTPAQLVGNNVQPLNPNQTITPGQQIGLSQQSMNSQEMPPGHSVAGQMAQPTQIRMAVGANVTGLRPRMPSMRGRRPSIRPTIQLHGQVRGGKQGPRMPLKRTVTAVGGPVQKKRTDMLLPGKHDNEDCHVMAMQKQREGMPLIQSVQGAKDKVNIGSQISMTKKPVNKEANAMANVLASRGISVKQKQKSRSPSPQRPLPNIPNLGAGVSIKHSSKSSNFSIPEAKVGGAMVSCKICKKMFMNSAILSVHMTNAHPQSKIPMFKCDECPAAYPKSLQLQHHKRVFHNVTGTNRELGLPVVDLSQEDNLKRLSNLGIYSFIPLANREQANGCFGIPVISVHNVQNGMTTSLQALGADGLLSLGPLKPLPNS